MNAPDRLPHAMTSQSSPTTAPSSEQEEHWRDLISQIGDVKVSHVYREGNTRADKLANLAMDTRGKTEPLGALKVLGQ